MKEKAVDWKSIELEYRAGIRTLRAIGDQYGVSNAGILKRAKRDGWTRDLAARIQSKADAKVREALVGKEVSKSQRLTENHLVTVNAEAIAKVRLEHRQDIQKARALTNSLFAELQSYVDEGPQGLEILGERSKTLRTLVDGMGRLIEMERQAFGIDRTEEAYQQATNLPTVTVVHVAPPVREEAV